MEYTITEKQNVNSYREPEIKKEYKNLTAAKCAASRIQVYRNTVMTIEINDTLIAYKKNRKWFNV